MTPREQQITIALACGWTERPSIPATEWHMADGDMMTGKKSPIYVWDGPSGQRGELNLPDYLNDLNAMHEAIGSLTGEKLFVYVRWLYDVTGAAAQSVTHNQNRIALMATAAQRAEAFLRTIGKWEESK